MNGKRFFSAASESQAVSEASAELGIPAAELAYQVRQGTLRPGRVVIVVDLEAPRREPAAPPAAEENRRERLARAGGAPEPRHADAGGRGEERARAPRPASTGEPSSSGVAEVEEVADGELPATGLDGARRAAAALVALSGLELAVEAREAEGGLQVELAGPGREALVARGGELLKAAEYLVRRMVRDLPEEGLTLDSGGFRAEREEALRQRAAAAAAEVRRTGAPLALEGLDAAERRVVHMAILAEDGVRSQSEGEGERRRLTIVPD
jgi:spoIIIJ-associated protein